MNVDNTRVPASTRHAGTPIFDQLASTSAADATPGTPAEQETVGELSARLAVLELFSRMKELEDSDGGWNGGDVVESLNGWFAEFGIDVDADHSAATRSLRMPTWLTRALSDASPSECRLVIHVATEHDQPLDAVRAPLTTLVEELGDGTSASVFDVAGHRIAQFSRPGAKR